MGGLGLRSERDIGTGQAQYCRGKPGLSFNTSMALRCKLYAELCLYVWSIIDCLRYLLGFYKLKVCLNDWCDEVLDCGEEPQTVRFCTEGLRHRKWLN